MSHYGMLAAEQLRRPNVSFGRALRNEALTVHGKIFAFLKGDRLVLKLPATHVKQLIGAGAAIPFTSGGRTMKQWVAVPPSSTADVNAWRTLLNDARVYVASGELITKTQATAPAKRRRDRKGTAK